MLVFEQYLFNQPNLFKCNNSYNKIFPILATLLVHSFQEIGAETGVPLEEGVVRVLHPDQPLPGEVEAVRVEAVVGAQGVNEKPLEAAQVFTNKLRVRVGSKLVGDFLLKSLKEEC